MTICDSGRSSAVASCWRNAAGDLLVLMMRTRSSSSIHTTQARGSRKPWNSRAVENVCSKTWSARAKTSSMLLAGFGLLDERSSRARSGAGSAGASAAKNVIACRCPGGATGASASSALSSVTSGRSSYSTSTRLRGLLGAALASRRRRRRRGRRPCARGRSPAPASPGVVDPGARRRCRRRSAPRARPALACGASMSTETMRACGRGLRVYASHNMPGMVTSAV